MALGTGRRPESRAPLALNRDSLSCQDTAPSRFLGGGDLGLGFTIMGRGAGIEPRASQGLRPRADYSTLSHSELTQ